jgi:hypothetical protein
MQKTRWASCSRHRTVSLNMKLLFLPPELVRYVFVHELCHTVHMNHSREFWRFLAVKEPRYKELDKQLRTALAAGARVDWPAGGNAGRGNMSLEELKRLMAEGSGTPVCKRR